MSRKKSPKDIAFEKERATFRQEKRELESIIKEKDAELRHCDDKIRELVDKISELEDWNRRLLEYMDLPYKDFEREMQRIKGNSLSTAISTGIHPLVASTIKNMFAYTLLYAIRERLKDAMDDHETGDDRKGDYS